MRKLCFLALSQVFSIGHVYTFTLNKKCGGTSAENFGNIHWSSDAEVVCQGYCEAYTPSSSSVYICCQLGTINNKCRVYESSTDGDFIDNEYNHKSMYVTTTTTVCSSVLSASTSAESVSVSYDSSTTSEEVNIISTTWVSWDVFFSNSDTTNCPITSCSLYESGCSTAMNDPVNMEGSSPWDMTAEKDWDAGYTQSLCVSCTNGAQTITIDNWSVSQTSQCGSTLTVPSSSPSAKSLTYTDYSYSSNEVEIYLKYYYGWDGSYGYFTNSDSSNCPITSCSLYDSDCSTVRSTNVWMDSSSPWEITADKNVLAGYSYTLCISCTNGAQTVQENRWVVTLAGCSSSLTVPSSSPSAESLTYTNYASSSSNEVSIYLDSSGWGGSYGYFSNSDSSDCPITSFSLFDSDCTTPRSTNVWMASSSPWAMTADKNVGAGYSYTVCISCTNGYQTVQENRWVITLTGCGSTLTVPSSAPSEESLTYYSSTSSTYTSYDIELDSSGWGGTYGYFTNSNPSGCPITSCTLYDSDCITERSTNVQMESSSPWQVTADRTVIAGYSYTLCVSCTNGYQTVTENRWVVTLVGCGSTLTVPSSSPSAESLSYTSSSTQVEIQLDLQGWDNSNGYFSNSDSSDCPITSCSLFDSDCSTPRSSDIQMASSSPWAVSASKNVLAGYSYTICVSCTNGVQTVTENRWVVTLTGCGSTLTAPTSTPDPVSLTYSSSDSSDSIYPLSSMSSTDWDTYFANTATSNCPITSCSLFEAGCSTALTSPVSIGSTSPFNVIALKSNAAGYTQTMCVSCTNGAQTVTVDNWSVTLTGCGSVLSVPSATPDATTVGYSTTTTSESVYPISTTWVSWNDFFSNTDSTNCPITGCTLKDSTCSTEVTSPVTTQADAYCQDDDSTYDSTGVLTCKWYSAIQCGNYDDDDFTASTQCCVCGGGTNDVIGVVATKNDADGYSETLCIECTNGQQTVQKAGWVVAQTDCSNTLTSPSSSPTSSLTYDISTSSEVIYPLSTMSSSDWDTYFGNTETTNCPITSCTLYDSDCTTVSTDKVTMGSLNPWNPTAMKNEIAGYTKTMCVKCTNGAQTVTRDNWVLTQTGCGSVLSVPSATPDASGCAIKDYSSLYIDSNIYATGCAYTWTDWNTYFGNTDSTNCPITSCTLYDNDCTTARSGDVFMGSSSPWLVEMLVNQINGFSHTVCASCTNGQQTVTKNGWVVTLNGCGDKLTVPSATPDAVSMTYSISDSDDVIYPLSSMSSTDWDTYFANTDSTHCGISSCSLFEDGSSTALTTPISVGSSSPFDVTALKSEIAGYSLTISVQCTNGAQTVQKDGWVVTLTGCGSTLSIPSAAATVYYQVDLTNAAFSPSGNWVNSDCGDMTADRCITQDQDLTETGYWTNTEPCACSISSGATANGEWTADFTSGYSTISYIEFIGRNNEVYTQSNGLEIYIDTTLCGTTADSNLHAWTTYTCSSPVNSNSIRISRGNTANFQSMCGVKVYSNSATLPFDLASASNSVVIYPVTSSWVSWDTYFSNTDSTNCPITTCSLFESGCSTSLTSPVSMESSSPWSVTAMKNEISGYSKTMCVSCSNGPQTVTKDSWTISQIDCSSVMTVPSAASDSGELTYDLDVGETSTQIYPTTSTWTDWNTYFGNTDTNNCGITSCTLYESDCSTALSDPVSMGSASPYDVTALKNVLAGYTLTMCVSCTNGAQTVQKTSWTVSQLTCQNRLTAPTEDYTTTMNYDVVTTTQTITPSSGFTTWDDFFSNTDPTNCPITSCTILQNTGATRTGTASMTSTSPWEITAYNNRVDTTGDGFGYTIYGHIKCANIAESVLYGNAAEYCADEGGDCLCQNGVNIYYGANDGNNALDNLQDYVLAIAASSGTTSCTDSYFGSDPLPGVTKACFCRLGSYSSNMWTIQQTYCSTLTDPTIAIPDSSFNFHATETTQQIYPQSSTWTNWDTFFLNTDTTNCAISSCTIYDSDCLSAFTDTTQVTFGSTDPWDATAVRNEASGYTILICVQCTNEIQTVQTGAWRVILSGCATVTVPSEDIEDTYYTYDNRLTTSVQIKPSTDWVSWDTYFSNTDTINCAFASCALYESDCSTLMTSNDYVTMETTSPWAITMDRSQAAGYSLVMCVRCDNTAVVSQKSAWSVQLDLNECTISEISEDDIEYYFDVEEAFVVSESDMIDWFESLNGNPTYDECTITIKGLYSDETCTTAYSYTDVTLAYDDASDLQMSFLTESSTVQTEVYLCVENYVNQVQSKKVLFQTCGLEELALISTSSMLIKSFSINSGEQTISNLYFIDLFESSNTGCPITSYRLVQEDDDGEYEEYEGTAIDMDEDDFTLYIDTDGQSDMVVFIEASSTNSESLAYLEVQIKILNTQPYFSESAPLTASFEFTSSSLSESGETFTFDIPEPIDDEDGGETVTMSIDGLTDWMIFDNVTNTISFEQVTSSQAGSYTLTVQLVDSQGASKEYEFVFEILAQEESQEETSSSGGGGSTGFSGVSIEVEVVEEEEPLFELDLVEGEVVSTEILKAKIDSISYYGETQIKFTKNMQVEFKSGDELLFNVDSINESILDVYVEPAQDRHLEDDFDLSTVNLTWTAVSYEKNILSLECVFNKPSEISPLQEQDVLVVHFKVPGWFYSDSLKKFLDEKYFTLRSRIRKQLENTDFNKEFTETSEQSQTVMKIMMVLSFLMNVFMTGKAMKYFVVWINAMQMIMHLPMMRPLLPPNVLSFIGVILPVVTFDLIQPEYSTDLVFKFDENPDDDFEFSWDSQIFGQMQNIGYESHNSMHILGSLFVFTVVYFVRVFVQVPLMWLAVKVTGRSNESLKNIIQSLFFGEILMISLEAYIEILIAGYLNFSFKLSTTLGEQFAVYVAYYCLALSLVLLPFVMIYILCNKKDTIRSEAFTNRWGTMYEGFRTETKWQIGYNTVFMLRRLIFLYICFFLKNSVSLQIIAVNLMNLSTLIYTGQHQPLESRFDNRLDMFNEFQITLITWHLMFYTEFISNMDTQFMMGWSMVISILVCTAVNIGIVLYYAGKTLGLELNKIMVLFWFAVDGYVPVVVPAETEEVENKEENKEKVEEVSFKNDEQIQPTLQTPHIIDNKIDFKVDNQTSTVPAQSPRFGEAKFKNPTLLDELDNVAKMDSSIEKIEEVKIDNVEKILSWRKVQKDEPPSSQEKISALQQLTKSMSAPNDTPPGELPSQQKNLDNLNKAAQLFGQMSMKEIKAAFPVAKPKPEPKPVKNHMNIQDSLQLDSARDEPPPLLVIDEEKFRAALSKKVRGNMLLKYAPSQINQ